MQCRPTWEAETQHFGTTLAAQHVDSQAVGAAGEASLHLPAPPAARPASFSCIAAHWGIAAHGLDQSPLVKAAVGLRRVLLCGYAGGHHGGLHVLVDLLKTRPWSCRLCLPELGSSSCCLFLLAGK